MKIAYLTAGAAGMICGSCLHDNTLAAAMLEEGEDVLLIPTYTPVRTDEPNVSQDRIFYGGIHVFLQQKWSFFRHPPQWFDRWFAHWLNHPALLGRLAGRASSVDPTQLGELTVSMLQGETGNQHRELDKLAVWLRDEIQPDVIHLSNSLMLGMARTLRKECRCPLVCTLSGEDLFLDKLMSPYRDQSIKLIHQAADQVDAWIAMNAYYADTMATYLSIDRRRVHAIPHGLKLDAYGTGFSPSDTHCTEKGPAENKSKGKGPTQIGYLARICPDKGLGLLVEACLRLVDRNDLPPWELHVAGYLGAGDRPFLEKLNAQIDNSPLANKWTYWGELDYQQKMAFYQATDLFSVPTVYPESKGLSVLEALASGIPVIVPAHGTFPELLTDTGGGLLCQPHDADDLATRLAELLLDPGRAEQLGLRGQQAILARYQAQTMAQNTLALYRQLTYE